MKSEWSLTLSGQIITQIGVGVPRFSDLYLMLGKVLQNLSEKTENKLRNDMSHDFYKILCAYNIK